MNITNLLGPPRPLSNDPVQPGVDLAPLPTMSDRPTPLTDANVASLAKAPDCFYEADHARDLERKLAEARVALESACDEIEGGRFDEDPRELLAAAAKGREALARIDENVQSPRTRP